MAKMVAGVNIVTRSPPPALAGCWPVQVAPTIAAQAGELPSTAFDVPILLADAELDPPFTAQTVMLEQDLRDAGKCPARLHLKDHSHISEISAINTVTRRSRTP